MTELTITTRPTIQDGIVVDYAAVGIEISASRNAVIVVTGVMRDDEELEAFERALRLAVAQFRHLKGGHTPPLEHGQTRKDGEA